MKLIATSDWHIGNMFHGNDRLPEHIHFMKWLLQRLQDEQPDALLIAGDVFDNPNPSASAQSAYFEFIADATRACPEMCIIITAGNHDSANRLEAPRAVLVRQNVEVRGSVKRVWSSDDQRAKWTHDYHDLIIPVTGKDGGEAIILAVPYLRYDTIKGGQSDGVKHFLEELTTIARKEHPGKPVVMMCHMYATGADIAKDSSEKIIIGGEEEVNMKDWTNHPDYMTCGHIHRRQHIWDTDWARYTGSVLPMSFAEKDYTHGVDLIELTQGHRPKVRLLEYKPQRKLSVLPEDDTEMSISKMKKLIKAKLPERTGEALDENAEYVALRLVLDKISNDEIKELEELVNSKNAILCKIQKIMPQIDLQTITGNEQITSVDDIINRNPMDVLKESFMIKHEKEMSQRQHDMLRQLLNNINTPDKE